MIRIYFQSHRKNVNVKKSYFTHQKGCEVHHQFLKKKRIVHQQLQRRAPEIQDYEALGEVAVLQHKVQAIWGPALAAGRIQFIFFV